MLEGNPCGVPDETILMSKGTPYLSDRASNGLAVILLEIAAFLAQRLMGFCVREAPILGCITGIAYPVKSGLGSPASDCEIHVAIFTDDPVGHIEGNTSDKLLFDAAVA